MPGDEARGSDKSVLRVLAGEAVWPPPVWIMRQAGRYLPEYRATRAEAGSFLDLCYNPALAAEVTLQPIRRYGFDASIMFSDILVVPQALGQHVWFAEGEGPRLEPIADGAALDRLGHDPLPHLAPVFEVLRRLSRDLPASTTLLGFCGAPWTVASYMIAGRGTPDQGPALEAWNRDPGFVTALIDRLVEASVAYLTAQFEAGADAVQLFESHGGSLGDDLLEPLCLDPVRRIIAGLRRTHPKAPVILFVRGAGTRLPRVVRSDLANGYGIDQQTDLGWALDQFPAAAASQGNLDPDILIRGGTELDEAVDSILERVRGRPHIFNLGHGITPPTPPENVARLVERIRAA